jgi:hypothetical protein
MNPTPCVPSRYILIIFFGPVVPRKLHRWDHRVTGVTRSGLTGYFCDKKKHRSGPVSVDPPLRKPPVWSGGRWVTPRKTPVWSGVRWVPTTMKFRAHTRNTSNPPDEIAFSDSFQRHRDASFSHCEGHNGWCLVYRMYVYGGDSDKILHQHITHPCPVSRFLDGEDVVWKKCPKFYFSWPFQDWMYFPSWKRDHPVDFSTFTWESWEVYFRKIWRFESVT